jgi:hypothetical protein
MTIYPKIENFDDFKIKNREYSQCKLLNDFSNLNCDKTYTNLVDFLHMNLGLSIKRKDINSLINTFQNKGLLVVINSSVQTTDKLPKYLKTLRRSIKRFDKKRQFAIDECNTSIDETTEGKSPHDNASIG